MTTIGYTSGVPALLIPTAGGQVNAAVCIPNISPRQQRWRLLGGVIQIGLGAVALAILVARGARRRWRLPLFFVFWGAAIGFFQWRDKT